MVTQHWPISLDVALLALTAVFCLWLAVVGTMRRRVAGATTFVWLMLALVVWTSLSALHRLVLPLDTRLLIAQFQVPGIVSVAPLWFLFALRYTRRPDRSPLWLSAIWILPIVVTVEVFLHGASGWYWTSVRQITANPAHGVEYSYGPLFWMSVLVSYILIVIGTWLVLRSLRDSPPQFRGQVFSLAIASVIPLGANALYLARLTPDYTPMAFAVSGGIFGWSLFRRYLLNLMPVARGMLFDRFGDAAFVLDAEYRVLDFNAAARSLFGEVQIGSPVANALPWWTRLISGDTRQADGPSVIRHGDRVLDVGVTPIPDHEGQLAGWLVVVRDITDRLVAEEERLALDRRLQEQQHEESLTLLAGGLAHDFNNLLAGIMGNADMLAMKLPPEAHELRHMTHAITVGAERAGDLVAKMLAYAGEGAGPAEPIDIDSLSREMVDLLTASVARHCHLVFEPATTALPPVMGDATQIRQILLNLIVNASESIDEPPPGQPQAGQVTLRTGIAHMPLPSDSSPKPSIPLPAGRYVFIDVSDTGAGMPPETVARMFDPFFTTKTTGRGLGLASVRGIVRQHHGALAVQSAEGRGTSIRAWLRAA